MELCEKFGKQGLTFDDVLLIPAESDVTPNKSKAIPHKERLATLHAICLQISRHISQKCS